MLPSASRQYLTSKQYQFHFFNTICTLQFSVASIVFLPISLTEFAFLLFAMDVEMPSLLCGSSNQSLFCGYCFQECGNSSSNFRPLHRRWQQYGDFRASEKFWIYLCSSCSRSFWRLYAKGEGDDYDHHQLNLEYMLFLKHELAKHK